MRETEMQLWDRIRDEVGIHLIADIGSGLQGTVYALEEDGLVAKITNSTLEAALAAVLIAQSNASLPRIHSVHRLSGSSGGQFLIVRDDVEDVVSVLDYADAMLERHLQNVFINIKYPAFLSPEIEQSKKFMKLTNPAIFDAFKAILDGAKQFEAETGIEILDLHFNNLGRNASGRIIIRDFGMNNIRDADCDAIIDGLPEIPDYIPEATFAM